MLLCPIKKQRGKWIMTKVGILVGSLRKESFSKNLQQMLQVYSQMDMKQNLLK